MPRMRDLPAAPGGVESGEALLLEPWRTTIVPSLVRARRAAAALLALCDGDRLIVPARRVDGGVPAPDVVDVASDGSDDGSADAPLPDTALGCAVDRLVRLDVAALRAVANALAVASRKRCRLSRRTRRAR